MIKVTIKKDTISIIGHALYDEYGKDIVCSSVSSIVITTVNALLRLTNSIEYNDADGVLIKILRHDDITDKLIENMIDLLEELKKQYPKYIEIRRC